MSLHIAASPQTIFRFFTDPERFARWVSAGVELDPRAGGALRIDFQRFGTLVSGRVLEIVPNERIVLSWGVEKGPQQASLPPGSTRVTITLSPGAGGTLVTICHSDLPSEDEVRGHLQGWRHYIASLSLHATQDEHAARLPVLVSDYVSAWNAADHAAREEWLARCCAEDLSFDDAFACTRSRGELAAHITGVSAMMPGLRLAMRGAPQLCHSALRFDWEVQGPDGKALMSGSNYGELDAAGRFRKLVGFPSSP